MEGAVHPRSRRGCGGTEPQNRSSASTARPSAGQQCPGAGTAHRALQIPGAIQVPALRKGTVTRAGWSTEHNKVKYYPSSREPGSPTLIATQEMRLHTTACPVYFASLVPISRQAALPRSSRASSGSSCGAGRA